MLMPTPTFDGEPEGMITIPYSEIANACGDLKATMDVFERYGVPAAHPDYLVSLTVTSNGEESLYTYDWQPKEAIPKNDGRI